jgi:hypothetical protein
MVVGAKPSGDQRARHAVTSEIDQKITNQNIARLLNNVILASSILSFSTLHP